LRRCLTTHLYDYILYYFLQFVKGDFSLFYNIFTQILPKNKNQEKNTLFLLIFLSGYGKMLIG